MKIEISSEQLELCIEGLEFLVYDGAIYKDEEVKQCNKLVEYLKKELNNNVL